MSQGQLFGAARFGAAEFGRGGEIEAAAPHAWGGTLWGALTFGFADTVAGEVTGDALAIGASVTGTAGLFAVLTASIGIEGSAAGAIVLTGLVTGELGVSGSAAGLISHAGTASADIGISGSAAGGILLEGAVTGEAIGIGGQAFGFSGAVASYERVGARLITSPVRARATLFRAGAQAVRGRVLNEHIQGRL